MSRPPAHAEGAFSLLTERGPEWLAAVARRRSRRAFDRVPTDSSTLDTLADACARFRPHPDARIELVRQPVVDVFTGVIGSYGKVTGAPHVLVFVGDARSDFVDQHVGYTGEAIVLEATRLGLDTCWVGGFFSTKRVASVVALAPGERVYAVSPVGTACVGQSLSERAMRGMAGAHKRLPLGDIAVGAGEGWPDWAVAAVETARVAPSALNRQPWRFSVAGGSLYVAKDSGIETPKVAKRLDCGIAMLHAELGARAAGVGGAWTDLSGMDVARFDPEQTPA